MKDKTVKERLYSEPIDIEIVIRFQEDGEIIATTEDTFELQDWDSVEEAIAWCSDGAASELYANLGNITNVVLSKGKKL